MESPTESSSSLKEEDPSARMMFEPVLVVSRLAQASLYPLGTKLYIRGNSIYIQPNTIIQPFTRWMAGDSREDLTYLYEPIRRFSMIYRTKTTDEQKDVLRDIVDKAIQGLEKLRDTYGTHRIIDHSLAYYQTFLVQCVRPNEKVFTHRTPVKGAAKPMITEIPEIDIGLSSSEENVREVKTTKTVIEKLSGVWTIDDIRMLRTMLLESDDASGEDEKNSRLKTLNAFLDSKELEIKKALDDIHRP